MKDACTMKKQSVKKTCSAINHFLPICVKVVIMTKSSLFGRKLLLAKP